MTRRELLSAIAVAPLCFAGAQPATLSVESYIFIQYAERQKKPLTAVISEVLTMARTAGFRNIELNPAFLAPDARDLTLSTLHAQQLRMPSVYVGGAMHEKEAADQTIAKALEIANICAPFGCKAVVNNPDPKPRDTPKTDAELVVEANSLNRLGQTLAQQGFELRVHHHTPQLENNAREWRYILSHADPQYVSLCVDADWAYQGNFDPLAFLREAGSRVRELHIRSSKNKLWLEDLEDSDIDYRALAAYLKQNNLNPLLVVELAYRPNTVITRPLGDDLRVSRLYAENIFGVHADG